jgi:hypothetical protein
MDTFTQWWIRRLAWRVNPQRKDLRNLPHETAEEYLARGGHITHCKSNCKEITSRWAVPTHPKSTIGQTIYDWRV